MDAPGAAILGGILGSLAFLAVVYMGLATGMTRMNFLRILGTMLTPKVSTRTAYVLGFSMHLMAGALFGLAHGAIINAIGVSSAGAAAGWGVLLGGVHGAIILAVMPMLLDTMHPLVRIGEIDRPRTAMTGFGRMTPMGSLGAHVAFGLVVAAVYATAGLHV